jgi:hypothetical protein
MISRIEQDHSRFREIIRGKIRQNLRKYISRGDLIAPKGQGSVTIPMPQINIPRFVFGDNSGQGVGQGEGDAGDPVGGSPKDGQSGSGKAGEGEGNKALEVEVSLEELAEIMGEELGLPNIQRRGTQSLETKKDRYVGLRTSGPESLRSFKATFKRALRRQVAMGTYDARRPVIVPIREDRRYRSWRTDPRPQSNAVIIYMMDVSGSMGDEQKEMVRIESFWIDTWLRSQYKGLESRYIIHDATARVVEREVFFRTRESGRDDDLVGVQGLRRPDRRRVQPGAVEHLRVPLLGRRQLVGRRHRDLHRPAQEPPAAAAQPVRLRAGRVAVRLGAIHQGPAGGVQQAPAADHVGDQDQGRHHGLDPRVSEGRPLMASVRFRRCPAAARPAGGDQGLRRRLRLDTFPVLFEPVDYRHMCEIAAYDGFPTRYPHWRFGMEYDHMLKSHTYGLSKIYELVINTNPCYAYLLEGNSLVDQKLVMAHVYGHCDFFKNNYFFSHTDRG